MKKQFVIATILGGLIGAAIQFSVLLIETKLFSLVLTTVMLMAPVICFIAFIAGAGTAVCVLHKEAERYKTAGVISTVTGLFISLPLSLMGIAAFLDSINSTTFVLMNFGLLWCWGIALTIWGIIQLFTLKKKALST